MSCALMSGAVGAAELGDVQLASFVRQPLAAEIELTMIEHPGAAVQARLAHPEVYRAANIGVPPVLSTLSMSVTRRDGRQFLHLSSTAPVESSHLHVYLELLDGATRNVRLVTLWLTADPRPAPAPVPAPAPPPVTASVPAPMPVPVVFQQPVVVPAPAPPPKPKHRPPVLPLGKKVPPLPLTAPAVVAPATCAAPPAPEAPSACAVLGARHTQLREQIGELENKVKLLQVAMGARPAAASTPEPPAAPKRHPARKAPPPPAPAPDATPWGWIVGAAMILLALAGALLLLWRRKKGGLAGMPRLAPMPRLRQLLKRKKVTAPLAPGME